jgi:aspartyl-tRNA(Asn)/glutamyl-tRNA(Gln) amidotransferase subunit B
MTIYEPVIGLEVHAELQTRSKMFCGCAVVDLTQAEPNSSACEICLGMPGTLPVVNRGAVEGAVRVALALHAEVRLVSVFARKNYFYPDLPKGFQISQYEWPLAVDGWLDLPGPDGGGRVRIRRVHLEEDTGKLFHRDGYSLVDYNRAGVPLVEVVTEPDLHSVEALKAFAEELRTVLRTIGVNSGDMEKGVMRFEANVSIRPVGTDTLGTRTEIKNLNSFRALVGAVSRELSRQEQVVDRGGRVSQETLGWDEAAQKLLPQRSKEEAHDYRYFPEPDLPPLELERGWVEELRRTLPELPEARRRRLGRTYGLSAERAHLLVEDPSVAGYFEEAAAQASSRLGRPPQEIGPLIANWIAVDLFSLLRSAGQAISASRVGPDALARIVQLVQEAEINLPSAKAILEEAFRTGADPGEILRRRGLSRISSDEELDRVVRAVLTEYPEQVRQFQHGAEKVRTWLFGQAMRLSGGRADPAKLHETLADALEKAKGTPPAGRDEEEVGEGESTSAADSSPSLRSGSE